MTLLHDVVNCTEIIEVVELLISDGADVNATNEYGMTPLHLITPYHSSGDETSIGIAKTLISAGADVNIKDNEGATPLHLVADSEGWDIDEELAEMFIAAGANVNAKDNDGYTPLHCAVQSNTVDFVQYLISHGADVNVKNNDGKTPLDIVGSGFNAEEKKRILREAMGRE